MTTIERHKELLKQSISILQFSIERGILENSRGIGFAVSSGSVDIFSIYLHKLGKISSGRIIEHNWFKKIKEGQKIEPLYEREINLDFPKKEEVYQLMCGIEEKRMILAYGNPSKEDIKIMIDSFWKLKEIIEKQIGEKL